MKAYCDSSSFAKRYIEETGSDRVEHICAEAAELGLSVLCVPEIISALNRRRREGTITGDHYHAAKCRLLEDVRDADIINLTAPVVGAAVIVLESSPVGTLDAMHVASALEWGTDVFVSSDKRQIDAARRMGLNIARV